MVGKVSYVGGKKAIIATSRSSKKKRKISPEPSQLSIPGRGRILGAHSSPAAHNIVHGSGHLRKERVWRFSYTPQKLPYHHLAMGFLHLFIVNKSGGLILHRPLSDKAPKIGTNEWLRIGSTFHSLHAIATEACPVRLPNGKNESE